MILRVFKITIMAIAMIMMWVMKTTTITMII